MDHYAVFEFEVFSLEHFESTLAVSEVAKATSRGREPRNLVRGWHAILSRIICLVMAANRRIQMLVRCVLMCGCRRVRKTRDVSLGIVLTVSDHSTLHAHTCMVGVQMSGSAT